VAQAPGALIIGGGTGIGFASAQRLAQRGCRVVIAGRRENVLRDAAQRLGGSEAGVVVAPGDAAVEASATELVESARRELGNIDIFVNCAGVYVPIAFEQLSERTWKETIAPTLDAQVFPAVAVARAMKESGGGRIVLMSSVSDPLSEPHSAHYSAAKAAVSSLARSIAVDLTDAGITANAVAPGWIHTEMTDEFARAASPESLRRVNLLARMGRADEVARVVEFLALDAPTYLTATTLYVDGGQTAMAMLP
jgi:NAD(P)-dependent dehydrogenase (short-subunit alcohol dehydrogenase family)